MSLKIVHVLMIIIIACMIYYVLNDINCNCLINGFSVGGSNINISENLILDDKTCPPPTPIWPNPDSDPCIKPGERTIKVGSNAEWAQLRPKSTDQQPYVPPKSCEYVYPVYELGMGYQPDCANDCKKCYQVDENTGIGKPCRDKYPDLHEQQYGCVADESFCQPPPPSKIPEVFQVQNHVSVR
jgi:hypothetical protein